MCVGDGSVCVAAERGHPITTLQLLAPVLLSLGNGNVKEIVHACSYFCLNCDSVMGKFVEKKAKVSVNMQRT